MITKNLFGMLTIMAFLMFGCGDATQRGGDDSTDTTEETEEAPSEEVAMEEQETVPMEDQEESSATQESEPATSAESEAQSTTQQEKAPPAPSKPKYKRVAYRAGTTSQVTGAIQGSNTEEYISTLPAEKLSFKLVTDNPAASLMVTDTGGKRLSPAGQEVTYTLPAEGDYLIKVFMNMANDASSQKADYRLQIRAAE